VPASVRRLVRRCLERDSRRRLRDMGEARLVLDDAIERPDAVAEPEPDAAQPAAARGPSRLPWLLAASAPLIAIAGVLWLSRAGGGAEEPMRCFTLTMPNSGNLRQGDGTAIAISPDGRSIVTRGGAGSDDALYLRPLDEFEAREIAGTAGGNGPELSPDGRWVAFTTPGKLSKIRLEGGAVVRIAAVSASASILGYHWADDAHIYYSSEGHIWRVPDEGGAAERLTPSDAGREQGLAEPYAVPDAGVVLANTSGGPKVEPQLVAVDLSAHTIRDLEMPGRDPRYLPSGHLLFRQADNIVAARFDVGTLEFRGSPVPVLGRAACDISSMHVAVSRNGTVAYLPHRPGDTQSVVYVDHSGKTEPVFPAGLPFPAVNDPRLSPDGTRLVVSMGTEAIWMVDLATQTPTLLTESGFYPLWSPDGTEVVFSSRRGKTFDVYRVPVDLSRPEALVLDAENNMRTMDWTADGIILREEIPEKGMDLLRWSDPSNASTITKLLDGPDDELAPVVSPDGKWMAYVSNYSGPDEIYMTAFPKAGARIQISNRGGHSPTWSPDAKRLYYLEGLKMVAVTIESSPAPRVVGREVLFEGEFVQYRWSRQYDLTRDGTRFVMIKNPPRGSVEVITNWFPELRELTE
jgi:serine/threonine-protein kinase